MSATELPFSALLGRKVRDSDGAYVGRLVEIEASIRLSATSSEYVFSAYHVSHYGVFDFLAGSILVQQLVERLGARVGYRCRHVAADALQIAPGGATLTMTYAISTST